MTRRFSCATPYDCCKYLTGGSINAHSGFNRDDLQGYCDLYAFVINSPTEHIEKVEKILNMVFENPKMLRYRPKLPEIRD